MRTVLWAAMVVGGALVGCGGMGSLPPGGPPTVTCEVDCVVAPTLTPDAGEPVAPEPNTSLWPLTAGSHWTYRITDDLRGIFEKNVTVQGPREVPDLGGAQAIAVLSIQPHLEELSWQVVTDGVAFRVREEDSKAGSLDRFTTWSPATIKSLADPRDAGWSSTAVVKEVVHSMTDGTVEEKDKTFVWRVLAVDEEVRVPAGTFKTLKVQRDRPDKTGKERIYWLAPGIGKVKEDGERLEELVRYEIKP